MFDPVEEVLKQRLGEGKTPLPARSGDCPTEKELWDYLKGSSGQEGGEIADHLLRCEFCLHELLLAQEVRPGIGFGPAEEVSTPLLEKATHLAKKGKAKKSKMKKSLWLFLSLFFIGASFFFPRYFLQCLTLGILFGVKWIFDTATTRSLIVMYEAWKEKNRGSDRKKDYKTTQ
ncbi:MAG: hypothetical protein HY590_07680 [Candidatus Omnitrophica bacterium]|nr:hypothetical protein [Candidatus Omnitrophota bacterium]